MPRGSKPCWQEQHIRSIPTDCAVCGLKLVLAPHLARSFHHLFPVSRFVEVPQLQQQEIQDSTVVSSGSVRAAPSKTKLDGKLLVNSQDDDRCCYACLRPLTVTPSNRNKKAVSPSKGTVNNLQQQQEELLRFQCPDCSNIFCIDCDAYFHETLHNCPGCLCR